MGSAGNSGRKVTPNRERKKKVKRNLFTREAAGGMTRKENREKKKKVSS